MTKALARRWRVDLSSDNSTWLRLGDSDNFAPTENANLQAADTYDTAGFNSFEKTMTGGKLVVKFLRSTTAGVPSDPAQKLAASTKFQFGDAARRYVRWYTTDGDTEAWTARALVDWQQSKTAVTDLEEVTVTLTTDGVISPITSPYAPTAAPVVTSVTPSGAAAGALITINGQGFIGTIATSGVKIGGVNATNWVVQSDTQIVATMPTGTAGSAPVIVTNATGASNSFAYTRA